MTDGMAGTARAALRNLGLQSLQVERGKLSGGGYKDSMDINGRGFVSVAVVQFWMPDPPCSRPSRQVKSGMTSRFVGVGELKNASEMPGVQKTPRYHAGLDLV